MVTFDASHTVTSPARWADDPRWKQVEAFDIDSVSDGVVVFSAHPDDETLGVGGLIAYLASRGTDVHVVVATGSDAVRGGELLGALSVLHAGASASFLELPDGGLSTQITRLEDAVTAVVERFPGAALLAPWPEDRHGDHRALGHVVAEVARGKGLTLLTYPVWLWQWGEPDDLPWAQALQIPLAVEIQRTKAQAVARFASQITTPDERLPVLSAEFLQHAAAAREVLIRADTGREGERDLAAHFERLHAEAADPWSVQTRWYERRKRSILVSSLPKEQYRNTLELGCSVGATTLELAVRSDEVLAVDGSTSAVERARSRTSRLGNVRVERMRLPCQWPPGRFDLIVVAEVGYYFTPDEWRAVIHRIQGSLCEGGDVVLCHWTSHAGDFLQCAAGVHEMFARLTGMTMLVAHDDDQFMLQVFRASGPVS